MDRLEDAEVEAAWAAYREDGDQQALELLIVHYQPLVAYFARKALAKAPAHQDPEEILSFAQRGLLDAISKFDPAQRVQFTTYASRRIPGAIVDGQREADPLTRPIRARVRALAEAQRRLEEEHGRPANVAELAADLQLPEDEVRHLQVQQQTLTAELDEALVDPSHFEISVEVDAFERVAIQMLARRITELTDRDRLFLLLYYEDGLSLAQVGAQLGINDSRASQIRREMVRALAS